MTQLIYTLFIFNKLLELIFKKPSYRIFKIFSQKSNIIYFLKFINFQIAPSQNYPSMAEVNTAPPSNQVGQAEQVDITNFLRHAHHPGIVFFTLLFKVSAIISFLFLNLFLGNEALTFIIVVIFSAFDFWFVKNVSGRILVGLRWWNEVKDDGTEAWIFESDHEGKK